MWRILILSFVILLSGCSMVTIDEMPQQQENTEVGQNQHDVEQVVTELENQEQAAEEEEEGQLRYILENILQLDWQSRETLDAQELQYLAFGDSLTRGVGDSTGGFGYTDRLSESMEEWPAISKVELDNRGKNGRRSDQLLALLARGHYDEELPEADLITMTLGGNDVMKVVKNDLFSLKQSMFEGPLIKFDERYRSIVEEIRTRNAEAPLILIGFYNPFSIITDEFTPFETIIDDWNDAIEQIAQEDVNACFVPIADLFLSNEDMVYHTDFFHPNATGYERMTKRIIETMQACDIEQMSDGKIGFEE